MCQRGPLLEARDDAAGHLTQIYSHLYVLVTRLAQRGWLALCVDYTKLEKKTSRYDLICL